jgi:DNA-nicking Smr family endonuclease
MPRRRLSPEEEELWRRVAATAAPLHDVAQAPPAPPPAPPRPPLVPALAPRRPARPPLGPTARVDLAPDPLAALTRGAPQMDRRRYEKLRRGRLEPEARLDLHGMTLERAHAALNDFVLSAHAAGLRLVLVITGKGREGEASALAPHRRGALRHSVPHWLATPPLVGKVLQLAPAHAWHGGGGAIYVYLRRAR